MVPVTTCVYLLINCFYFFDNFLRKNISPTFRTRMRLAQENELNEAPAALGSNFSE
jgi:hypothetical protein